MWRGRTLGEVEVAAGWRGRTLMYFLSPVEGDQARLTFGGFLTTDVDRTRIAFWS